jgi:aspartate/methionine/tyrosine aminotransferase
MNPDLPSIAGLKVQMTTLTDYEQLSMPLAFDLANGHAYQDVPHCYNDILGDLRNIWKAASDALPADIERELRLSFATLIGSAGLKALDQSMISPTASNSIDIVAACMAFEGAETLLVEPTFDNLSLLFMRRGAAVVPLAEDTLIDAIANHSLDSLFARRKSARSLFIVNPNNPTGQTLDEVSFRSLCEACAHNNITLIIDNSFRMFKREMFDDYAILMETGVDFIAFEDTGKCWPTLDLKLSMMFSSIKHLDTLQTIYRELYLAASPFSVALFTELFKRTHRAGIKNVVWDLVDHRRARLREVLRNSQWVPITSTSWSPLPVEWVSVERAGKIDLTICREMAREGLGILPGRHFFWSSVNTTPVKNFVRISLLKPTADFAGGLEILARCIGGTHTALDVA